MLKKLVISIITLSLAVSAVFGMNGARFNVIDGDIGEKYDQFIQSDAFIKSSGFAVTDVHEKINDAYKNRYGNPEDSDYDKDWNENLDNLGFYPVTNDKALRQILLDDPEIAAFAPFNLLIYKKKSEGRTYIGHITPETMLNIAGVENPKTRDAFAKMFKPLDQSIQESFAGKVDTTTFASLPNDKMMRFEYEFKRPEDLNEFTDKFQENFEEAFEAKHYIIAGFKNFKEVYSDMEEPFEKYDAFFVYGLCHFTFSYNLFNKGRPDAGVFAPCSMYMYIPQGSNKMMIGMPRLSSWVAVLNIRDPKKVEWTKKIDNEILLIMKQLGAKEI